jgi:WhiB family transcriptional regulator, redox-sensing transcriptional regulator
MRTMIPVLTRHVRPCVCCHELIAPPAKAVEYGVKVHAGRGKCHPCWRKGLPPTPEPVEPARSSTRRDMSWQRQAICVGEDPEIFSPLPNDTAGHERARAICRRCPVAAACVEDALTAPVSLHCVRGGFSGDELTALYRRRNAA